MPHDAVIHTLYKLLFWLSIAHGNQRRSRAEYLSRLARHLSHPTITEFAIGKGPELPSPRHPCHHPRPSNQHQTIPICFACAPPHRFSPLDADPPPRPTHGY